MSKRGPSGKSDDSDLCDVCGAPATYWQRYAGHWDDECMDRCGRHKPTAPDVDAVLAEWRARAATSPVDTMEEFMRLQDEAFLQQAAAGYALGVQYSMQRLAQSERILTDLITELYAAHDRDDLYWTAAARESLMMSAADRAQARLWEVTGDE